MSYIGGPVNWIKESLYSSLINVYYFFATTVFKLKIDLKNKNKILLLVIYFTKYIRRIDNKFIITFLIRSFIYFSLCKIIFNVNKEFYN